MAKKRNSVKVEPDGVYFLKLMLYVIVGSQWLFLVDPNLTKQIPVPMGLIIGFLFATHEHFKIDRKIEFAVLLIACLVGFWARSGVLITIL